MSDLKTIISKDVNQLSDKQLIIAWPGHQTEVTLAKPLIHLGRSPHDNEVVINYPVVSRHHATIKWEDGHYQIMDGQTHQGQHQPSGNGLYFEGKRINQHVLKSGDILRIPDQNDNFITLMYFDGTTPADSVTDEIELVKEITIGRDPRNDLVLTDPLVSSFHATVMSRGNGHAIRDLKSSSGIFVNGQRVQQADLQVNDAIQVGSAQLRYDGRRIMAANLRRDGIKLAAIDVHKQVKVVKKAATDSDMKVLLNHISLVVEPREFVALVGGSGAGKSTLLGALNGSRPTDGQILINGDDLYRNFEAYRCNIGYVPQDDIIHGELTVEEALTYVARLRLPADTPADEMQARIAAVLDQVAMSNRRTVPVKQLSGGQRKRVSIAVELIADPGIIFLDEPTSGLDPGLDKKMMFTLKQLAQAGKTVILVTHATGNITECSMVAFLAEGGRLVFYGPPQDALTFFGTQDFAEIYHKIELESEKWIDTFQKSPYYQKYVQARLVKEKSAATTPTATQTQRNGLFKPLTEILRQMVILTQRNLALVFRDRRNLLFLMLQAPIVAMLLFFVINDSNLFSPCPAPEYSLKVSQKNDVVYVVYKNAQGNCTPQMEQITNIQKIMFMMACVAIWLGVFSASREIVKELPIYRRERLVNLSIPAYIFSKLVLLFGLSLLQVLVLVLMLHLRAPFVSRGVLMPGVMEIFLTMLILTFTAACFGLFLSAIVGREDRIMSIMPVFLILQIVFAGIIFPFYTETKQSTPPPVICKFDDVIDSCYLSLITFSRWGIEAMGSTETLPALWEGKNFGGGQLSNSQLPFRFDYTSTYLLRNWAILLGFTLLSIGLTFVALKRQDVHK